MKLVDTCEQPPVAGLPGARREWWDLGDGYEICIEISTNICSLGIREKNKRNITFEVAKLLNVDLSEEKLIKRNADNEELFISLGIDCVVLNYRHPEKYKKLLVKIEKIVHKHFKKLA